jgi:hypothetical protein
MSGRLNRLLRNAGAGAGIAWLVTLGAPIVESRDLQFEWAFQFPDGTACKIDIVTSRESDEGRADVGRVLDALQSAYKASADMQAKVREACIKWKGQIIINVMRGEPTFDSAGVQPDTNQMYLDLSDLDEDGRHLTGPQQGIDNFNQLHLSSTIAHEFEHLKDGVGERAHRDPPDNCAADQGGPAVADENKVMEEMHSILVRLNYGDVGSGTIRYRYGGVPLTLDMRAILRVLRGLPPRPARPPNPLGPSTPGQIYDPPGSGIAEPHDFPALPDIPDAPCPPSGGTRCYPLPSLLDRDLDGVPDARDNCPSTVNPQQGDGDGNGIGDACDRGFTSCGPASIFTHPKVIGLIAGGVVGGIAILNGGGPTTTTMPATAATSTTTSVPATATTTSTSTTSTTSSTTSSTTTTAPVTVTGVWMVTGCRAVDDVSFHEAVIRMCQSLNILDLAEAAAALSMSGPSPFVMVSGPFSPGTGLFSGTGRGTVAGFQNVGIRADGTITGSNGQGRLMYTMGTGGELPTGRSVTYEITLAKQAF